jgi:hypothetical protein
MKLFRFGKRESEKPGVILEDGSRLDVSLFGDDFDELFSQRMVYGDCNNGLGKMPNSVHVLTRPLAWDRAWQGRRKSSASD